MPAQIAVSSCIEMRSNPGFYLRSDAAKAWDRAVAAFGKRVLITGAWRSYETQLRIFEERYDRGNLAGRRGYTTDVRWWPAKGSYYTRKAGTAAAAVPGTSNHGGGVAVDVKTSRSAGDPPYAEAVIFAGWNDVDRVRFLRVAAEHGWDDDEGRSVGELWHLTYYADRDQHRGEAVPTPPQKEKDFMATMSESEKKALLDGVKAIRSMVDAKVLEGPYEPVSKRKWVSVTRALRLIRLNGIETRSRVQDMQAQLRGLRSVLDTLAKSQNLDPERIYALVDQNLKAATADLKITFSTDENEEEEVQP